jgi:hypothetical protein
MSHSATSRLSRSQAGFGSLVAAACAGFAAAVAVSVGRKAAKAACTGEGHSIKHRLLDAASGVMQPKYPIEAMSTYLNGFHFYADDMGRQVSSVHFCTHLRHDLHQCVIYDSNRPDARLIGIEYIISAERFRALPDDEKRLWHSHHYEVKSGLLVAPGIPELAERTYFQDLVTTYGKTFHTWQIDRADFPFGIPQLMMGFTADGQIDEQRVADRDCTIGVSSSERRRLRETIPMPELVPGANGWETGQTVQTCVCEQPFRR